MLISRRAVLRKQKSPPQDYTASACGLSYGRVTRLPTVIHFSSPRLGTQASTEGPSVAGGGLQRG